MIIIGAGMAGLITANVFRKQEPIVVERAKELPNNHSALLRFKTDTISKATGIPFRKVYVRKAIIHSDNYLDKPNPYVCNMYSQKVAGKVLDRSIWDLSPGERYIAPPDFIHQLSVGLNIKYSEELNHEVWTDETTIKISTIPMPSLMEIVNWHVIQEFKFKHIVNLSARIDDPDCDIYQTLYFTDLDNPCYRASIIGNYLVAEFIAEPEDLTQIELAHKVLDYFGISNAGLSDILVRKQAYGKIVPIDDDARKNFIYSQTRDHSIYSIGRYATWRQLVLDDLVRDARIISGMIAGESYRQHLSSL